MIESGFLEALQDRINATSFDLPQSKRQQSAHFCNEAVYGSMNVLRMTGMLRLCAGEGVSERGAASKAAYAEWVTDAAAEACENCDVFDEEDFEEMW